MDTVYHLEDGRKLVLYMENNKIQAVIMPVQRGSVPVLCRRDCLGQLSSAVFGGKIYYVYENFSHQVVFCCLEQEEGIVILSPYEGCPAFEGLKLVVFSGHLRLFYMTFVQDCGWEVRWLNPRKPHDVQVLSQNWEVKPELFILREGKKDVIDISGEGRSEFFIWDNTGFSLWNMAEQKNKELLMQIESIKGQYEELADCARELQKIGKYWRDKAMSKR